MQNYFQFALGLSMLALAGCSADKESPAGAAKEFHLSFKGLTAKPDNLEFFGPDAAECVHFEPEGLRIKTSTEFPNDHPSTGVVYGTLIKGDFEITTDFEILHEPLLLEAESDHTRFTMDVVLDGKDGLVALSRRVAARKWLGGTQFGAYTRTPDEATNRPKERFKTFPTLAKTGRLRIARKGSNVSFEAAEGRDGEFKVLQEVPFDPGDVSEVRLIDGGGGPHGWLEARVTDLTIRADALPVANTVSFSRARWLTVGIVVAFVAALIGVRIWLGRRKRPGVQGNVP